MILEQLLFLCLMRYVYIYIYIYIHSKRVGPIYALTGNAEEAEVEWFCEDLQDLLELHPKKMTFSL